MRSHSALIWATLISKIENLFKLVKNLCPLHYSKSVSKIEKIVKILHVYEPILFTSFFSFAVPSVSISGEKEMHVEAGSSVVLKCSVSDYLKRPTFIFWYRDDERLVDGYSNGLVTIEDNLGSSLGNGGVHDPVASGSGLKVTTQQSWQFGASKSQNLYSILTVTSASSQFSGRYSCSPDNLRPASINVHVILGKFNPAWKTSIFGNNSRMDFKKGCICLS